MLRLPYWSSTEMLKQRLPRELSKVKVSQFISCKYHRNNKNRLGQRK